MLRKMRVRMALLNAFISGTILLAMAFVGLNVAQTALSGQYERDLMRNTAQVVTAMTSADDDTKVQFASNYVVYQEQGGEGRFIGTTDMDPDALQLIADQVRDEVMADGVANDVAAATTVQRFYAAVPSAAKDGGATLPSAGETEPVNDVVSASLTTKTQGDKDVLFIQTSAFKIASRDDVLVAQDGLNYRVKIPVMDADNGSPQMIMVLQDRTDELSALHNLRLLFFGCALGGLVLTLMASLYLSARSVRPVERSIKQQREFVAAASHELRTPIAALCANAEVLTDAQLGEFEPYLQSITDESGRLGRLVGDLMSLARADADAIRMQEEPVDLMEVARQVAAAMRSLAGNKGIALTESLESVVVKGDDERLKQALMALVDNAIRYTPEGGHVHIASRRQGGYAILGVADDGPGIPDKDKPRAFERFYRVDESRASDGCGLGLSVARTLVEQMAGTITLTDTPQGGCNFEIRMRAERRPRRIGRR